MHYFYNKPLVLVTICNPACYLSKHKKDLLNLEEWDGIELLSSRNNSKNSLPDVISSFIFNLEQIMND